MADILFVHQNMPGQFRHLAPALAKRGDRVVFLTKREDVMLPGVSRVSYRAPRGAHETTHPYLRLAENSVLHGQQVARALVEMMKQGFRPELVVGHPGWGELLYVKDVLPEAKLLSYAEFYYRGRGTDVGFDPAEKYDLDTLCRVRTRTTHLLLSLEACDRAISPTQWQKSVHPEPFHDRIAVIFDGIDTNICTPDGDAALVLADGTRIARGDPVVTYVARNLEPYRGFRTFMHAVPDILAGTPGARIVIVGGDDVSYGGKPKDHANWREAMLAEVAFDRSRVHFTGRLPYGDYLKLMRASAAHVYLTYPFVLSWSCLEAMACGALLIGSDTAPVREVIRDGENGLLTDFFDHRRLARRVTEALAEPERFQTLRLAAAATVRDNYALDRCLPQQIALVDSLLAGKQ